MAYNVLVSVLPCVLYLFREANTPGTHVCSENTDSLKQLHVYTECQLIEPISYALCLFMCYIGFVSELHCNTYKIVCDMFMCYMGFVSELIHIHIK